MPIIIFNLVFAFGVSSYENRIDTIDVYLVKESWHTGIMFEINEFTIGEIPALKLLKNYLYADIGWGDADFYQATGTDIFLAAKAILVPTATVIRIDGYNYPMDKIIEWREYAIKFEFSADQFKRLTKYINDYIVYDQQGEPIITKHESGTPIYFIKSYGEYHLFRTCNTWAAETLNSTGITVDTFGLITASQLYSNYAKYGKVIKRYD